MARLNFRNTTPPGGWKFYEHRTRLTLSDHTFSELRDKVIDHRRHKGLEPTDADTVSLEIERQICARLSKRDCTAEGTTDEWVPIDDRAGSTLDLVAILSFSKAALDWLVSGAETVPLAEAQRRREICAGCPLNNPASGCKCGPLYALINAAVPADKRWDDLHICAACACTLKAKVHLPMSMINESNEGRKLDFPRWCWQRHDHEAALLS